MGVSRIYAEMHFVSLSVVFAIHRKDIFILSEFLQLLEFSVA
jgi:hypothetical protein